MQSPRERSRVAIAGNPNTGKTSVFNRLTGANLKVGNYPGITVERFEGSLTLPSGREVVLMDVPGTYSLSARSREEQIAIQAVAGLPPLAPPDLVVLVVDATQLTRNLYLALQVLETDVPTVIALTMADMLPSLGQQIDIALLQRELGVPAVAVHGQKGAGIDDLRRTIDAVLADPASARGGWRWQPADDGLRADIEIVAGALPAAWANGSVDRRRALAVWALLSVDDGDELADVPPALRAAVDERRRLADAAGRELESEVIRGRYEWIDAHAAAALGERTRGRPTRTERVDALLLHPALGFALFLLAMGIVFQSLFSWADPAIGWIEALFGALAGAAQSTLPAGILRDFVTEGLIAGVGSVVVFLPQILLLFLFIGVMEDTGYMARVAFLMDRIMKALGLHGRAFVPMMSGFACAIPAIMATRTMERQRDRMLTMMVVPLMTCSARLPVYALLIGALFPPDKVFGLLPVQGLLMVAMYVFSTLVALSCAAVLGRTVFKGPKVPLLLELPPYRVPHWKSVLRMMWTRGSLFLREAGGVILVCTIALWLLLSFPRHPALEVDYGKWRAEAVETLAGDELAGQLGLIDTEEESAVFRRSYGARLGRALEPAIAPLGFDWKIGIGLIGAFAAREVFVSTMGVVYGVSDEAGEGSVTLRTRIRREARDDGRPVYTPLVGLSLMVFFALACQCMSTLAVTHRETRSWRWPVFMFAYMTTLAWLASLLVYQGGRLLGFG